MHATVNGRHAVRTFLACLLCVSGAQSSAQMGLGTAIGESVNILGQRLEGIAEGAPESSPQPPAAPEADPSAAPAERAPIGSATSPLTEELPRSLAATLAATQPSRATDSAAAIADILASPETFRAALATSTLPPATKQRLAAPDVIRQLSRDPQDDPARRIRTWVAEHVDPSTANPLQAAWQSLTFAEQQEIAPVFRNFAQEAYVEGVVWTPEPPRAGETPLREGVADAEAHPRDGLSGDDTQEAGAIADMAQRDMSTEPRVAARDAETPQPDGAADPTAGPSPEAMELLRQRVGMLLMDGRAPHCLGVLIGAQQVLTARHCIATPEGSPGALWPAMDTSRLRFALASAPDTRLGFVQRTVKSRYYRDNPGIGFDPSEAVRAEDYVLLTLREGHATAMPLARGDARLGDRLLLPIFDYLAYLADGAQDARWPDYVRLDMGPACLAAAIAPSRADKGGFLMHGCNTQNASSGAPVFRVDARTGALALVGVHAGGFGYDTRDAAVWADFGLDTRYLHNFAVIPSGPVWDAIR